MAQGLGRLGPISLSARALLASITWRWYSGGWTNALEGHADSAPFGGGFQFHHQPFDYYANFAPLNPDGSQNPQTSSLLNPNAHLQDETQFFADLTGGTLPAVSFIKPIGANNEHPGYANLLRGQQHVADIVHAIQNSGTLVDGELVAFDADSRPHLRRLLRRHGLADPWRIRPQVPGKSLMRKDLARQLLFGGLAATR